MSRAPKRGDTREHDMRRQAEQRQPCGTCNRDPKRMNSSVAECSHVECPHRRGQRGDWGRDAGWKPRETPHDPLAPLLDKVDE